MSWDHQKYVDFIKKEAPAADRSSLLQASSRPFVPKDPPKRGKSPQIFVTYYSMPDWLDIFSSPPKSKASPNVRLDSRLGKVPFSQMIGEYRRAAQQHQDKVTALLALIDTFPSGKALLAELGSAGHSIRIMPYWHYFRTMVGGEYFNSTPIPVKPSESMSYLADGGLARDYKGAYERNAPVRGDDNNPMPSFGKGTGAGANVVLFFSAETWDSKAASEGPGFKADEVLFHELVHITRMIRGQVTRTPVDGGGYGNIEEYFATVITNVYMSDKGQTRLRGLYSNDSIRQNRTQVKVGDETIMVSTDPLPKDWNVMKDPDKFFDNVDKLTPPPRDLMQIFKAKQTDFYLALAHLPEIRPTFNPVGRHFRANLQPAVTAPKANVPTARPKRP
jgi:NleD-like pathogen effector protein (putative zinc metallopeptidase)